MTAASTCRGETGLTYLLREGRGGLGRGNPGREGQAGQQGAKRQETHGILRWTGQRFGQIARKGNKGIPYPASARIRSSAGAAQLNHPSANQRPQGVDKCLRLSGG